MNEEDESYLNQGCGSASILCGYGSLSNMLKVNADPDPDVDLDLDPHADPHTKVKF